jgi:hypothetical protein
LERAFEECDIFEAVKAFNDDKARVLTSFLCHSSKFVGRFSKKIYWIFPWLPCSRQVLKEDIMNVSMTFIALIPKQVGAVDIKDFLPINIVSGVYKIVAKVFANRLKMVLRRSFPGHRMHSSGKVKF